MRTTAEERADFKERATEHLLGAEASRRFVLKILADFEDLQRDNTALVEQRDELKADAIRAEGLLIKLMPFYDIPSPNGFCADELVDRVAQRMDELLKRVAELNDENTVLIAHSNDYSYTIKHLRSQWQPIETAIKDSTPRLLIRKGFVPVVGRWHNSKYARWIEGDSFDNKCQNPDCFIEYMTETSYEPTHWMPLPTPPQAEAAQLDGIDIGTHAYSTQEYVDKVKTILEAE